MSADASARLCQQLRHAKSSECGDHVSKFASVCVQKGFIRFLSGWTGCSQLSHFCIWEENWTKMCHPFEFEWANICPSAKCRMHNGVNHFEVGLFDAKNCQIYTFSVLSALAKNSALAKLHTFCMSAKIRQKVISQEKLVQVSQKCINEIMSSIHLLLSCHKLSPGSSAQYHRDKT